METFGGRLRSIRRQKGLSQSELGGQRYSASYISHLESGRRQPTGEFVAFAADRLAVPEHELAVDTGGSNAEGGAAALATARELRVLEASERGDYEAMIRAADQTLADDSDAPPDARWTALYAKAQAHLREEEYEACIATTELLLEHPLSATTELRARVFATRSTAQRASGDLLAAVNTARASVEAARQAEAIEQLIAGLRAEIAALAELGREDEAISATERLDAARQRIPHGQVSGLAAWTIGNMAFVRGDIQTGIKEHTLASSSLRPEADLRTWARFHKASAAMRIAANVDDGVDALLESAAHGLAIVGNFSDIAELELLRAERALAGSAETTLALVANALSHPNLPAQTIAEAKFLQARAHIALGDTEAARNALTTAASEFERIGADRRAMEVWRFFAGHAHIEPALHTDSSLQSRVS